MEANPGLLPADVLLKIFSYCSYRDLVQFQFVCRWWQQVSRHSYLWRDIVYKPGILNTSREIIENLRKSPELRALHLKDVKCTDVTKELVIEIVNACPRLEQLSVCWCCLYEKFHFEMETIKILILVENDYADLQDYFEHIYNCFPNVEHLDCSNLTYEFKNFRAYLKRGGQSLHTLGLNCRMFARTHMQECNLLDLSMCTNLTSLILANGCIDMECLPFVVSINHLKQISSLRLQIVEWVSDYSRYFPNLVELELDRCRLGNEQALHCPLLEKLTLSNDFSDDDLMFVSHFKKLTSLCLRNSHYIRDSCVAYIQDILNLRYLDISNCYKLTPQCLLALCSIAKLQILKFDLLKNSVPTDLDGSQVKNPNLHIMFYNCTDMRGLHHLRRQRLRISLLKGCDSVLFCHHSNVDECEYQREFHFIRRTALNNP